MKKENFGDLLAFVTVARELSFTKAAPLLGISRSALSHAISALEVRLGVRLLARTTRSMSLTEAGARLLDTVGPHLTGIDQALGSINQMRGRPVGTVRITAHDHPVSTIVWPKLMPLLKEHPDINLEFSVDYAMSDITAQRFDAGIRLGSNVDRDMIAVRIAPDLRMAIAGAPEYLANSPPVTNPKELAAHNCINLRLATHGGLYAWELQRNSKKVTVRVKGQTVFNKTLLMLQASLDGVGLVYMPLDILQPHFDSGRLVPVLADWWPLFPGYHIYYANRSDLSPALALVVEALRYRTSGRPADSKKSAARRRE